MAYVRRGVGYHLQLGVLREGNFRVLLFEILITRSEHIRFPVSVSGSNGKCAVGLRSRLKSGERERAAR